MGVDLRRPAALLVNPRRVLRNLALAAVLIAASARLAPADVTGEGDVLPKGPVALPIDGGMVMGDIIVGGTGDPMAVTTVGRLTIDNPAFTLPLTSANGFIGFNSDGIGIATVSGLLSEWSIDDKLSVGVNGEGYLEVTGGAVVRTSGAAQSPEVDAIVGELEGSQGFVSVTGFGSLMRSTELTVGLEGTGRIEVLNRGRLETLGEVILGDEQNLLGSNNILGVGYVLLDGLGTRWNVGLTPSTDDNIDGVLRIGGEGRGTVDIRNGALLRVETDTHMGRTVGSHGAAFVSGQNSLFWTLEGLYVGDAAGVASAELHISNQAMVRADGDTSNPGTIVGPRGLIELSGGTLLTPNLANAGIIRGDGRIESEIVNNSDIRTAASVANLRERLLITGAVTNMDNIESIGGEIAFNSLVDNNGPEGDIFGVDAIFRFHGGLNQNSRMTIDDGTVVEALTFANNGVLAVGSTSESFVLGDLTLGSSSTMLMDLGEPFSHLVVSGDADLAGTLDLGLVGGFRPESGDSFEVITTSGNVGGTFGTVVFPVVSGISWNVEYLPQSVVINAAPGPALSADFDTDGDVDGSDFLTWQRGLGIPAGATLAQGDANGDGAVNGADLAVWRGTFGSATAAASAVPEPAAWALALAALALIPMHGRLRI